MSRSTIAYLFTGLTFAILWSSASIAGKFGLRSSGGLTLFTIRFLGAGALLIAYSHGVQRHRLPLGKEWYQIIIFGIFNTALYLGLFIVALKSVAAGITALSIALNPLLISVLTSIWMKRKVRMVEWISIGLGIIGVAVAVFPLLHTVYASVPGLILLALSMVAYSVGAVYYSSITWTLPRLAINGWQVLIGGLLLLPFAVISGESSHNYNLTFWLSLLWLIVPVSIFAVQLWLRLLREDAVRASLWLFLCPVSGLGFATLLLHEPFMIHTAVGATIVLAALYIGQQRHS